MIQKYKKYKNTKESPGISVGDKAGFYSLSDWVECPAGSAVCGIRFHLIVNVIFIIVIIIINLIFIISIIIIGGMLCMLLLFDFIVILTFHNIDLQFCIGSSTSITIHHFHHQDPSSGGRDWRRLKSWTNWSHSSLLPDSIAGWYVHIVSLVFFNVWSFVSNQTLDRLKIKNKSNFSTVPSINLGQTEVILYCFQIP